MMECRIEAGDLGQFGEPRVKSLGEQDFLREVLGIERRQIPEVAYERRRDPHWLIVFWAAMHHSMADCSQLAFLDTRQ